MVSDASSEQFGADWPAVGGSVGWLAEEGRLRVLGMGGGGRLKQAGVGSSAVVVLLVGGRIASRPPYPHPMRRAERENVQTCHAVHSTTLQHCNA